MAQAFVVGGGGGGVGSDEVTATSDKVVKGYTYVGADTNDDPGEGALDISGTADVSDVVAGQTFTSNNESELKTGTLALTGDAAAGDVLSGKIFYNSDPKNSVTGTMKNNGVASVPVGRNASVDLEGYYAAGSKATGQAASDLGATTHYATTANHQIIAAGVYTTGAQNIGAVSTTAAAGNVANGTTIYVSNGQSNIITVTGTYKGLGNAVQSDVRTGKTFSTAALSNVSGTLPQKAGWTVTPSGSAQTLSVSGNIMTSNITVSAVANLSPGNIKKGVVVGGVTGTWEGFVITNVTNQVFYNGAYNSGWAFGTPSSTDRYFGLSKYADSFAVYTKSSNGGMCLAYYKTPITATKERGVKATLSGTGSHNNTYFGLGFVTTNPANALGKVVASTSSFPYKSFELTGLKNSTSPYVGTLQAGFSIDITPNTATTCYCVLFVGTTYTQAHQEYIYTINVTIGTAS